MLRQIRKLLLVIGFILFAIFLSACSENANLVDPDAIFSDKYDDELRVHFLYLNEQSEKTGESIFVQTPDGTSILIDAGIPEAGTTVVKYLDELGIDKIDYVMPSHPHIDHIGGLLSVIKNKEVGEIIEPDIPYHTQTYADYVDLVEKNDIPVQHLTAGDVFEFDNDITLEVYNPPAGFTKDDVSETMAKARAAYVNNLSHVMKLTYGEHTFLFTGDIYIEKEMELVKEFGDELASYVLVPGHHGYATSSSDAFIETVDPEYAVIPANAIFEQSIIRRLEGHGVDVYHNFLDGNILMATDGKELKIIREKEREEDE